MAPKRDKETGRYSEEYPLEDFLESVQRLTPVTTSAVAEDVGCSYDSAYRKLIELNDTGKIDQSKIGDTYLWVYGD